MYRDRSNLNIRLLGAGIVLVGFIGLLYLIRSRGEIIVVLGAIVVAVVTTGMASASKSDDKAKKTSKVGAEPSALSRSFGKWWRS